jgi:adenosylcobinamide-GDP ribazoletransferase
MKLLGVAFGFLTIFPIKTDEYIKGDIGRAAVYFPFVGLAIGGIVGFLYVLLLNLFTPVVAVILSVALWAGLSGFLHLDGLSDCADALFYAGNLEKRLAILKDSRVGSFAAISLILYFLMKTAAFSTLPVNPEWAIFLITYASVMGRWVMLFIALISEPARASGMGTEFKIGLQRSTWWVSLLLPVTMTILGSYFFGLRILITGAAVVLLGWAISQLAKRQLGGFTGDVLGMAVEISELLCLLIFAIR